ncbi:MAG TPA: CHAT domain-containing protein, partial [Conexibacter sp.]|nr:CHAT domain-containing protein [Conexibacter sp.]
MANRLIVDLGADGEVSVAPWFDGELPSAAASERFPLHWPLDADRLEALRWYLEDYLRAPYGVFDERGREVAAALEEWGAAVFASVFGAGAGRDAYLRMRERPGGIEVVFRSDAPALLALPWELLRDPARPTPLALDQVGVTRSLPADGLATPFAVGGERLRVLMVISRPEGARDVGFRMIARPLLERLEAVRGRVELVVLRPPTLETLRETLAAALAEGQPFQVVHFDGHGALAGARLAGGASDPLTFREPGPQGMLVFEQEGGGRDDVPAETLAQVVKEGKASLVVLNACQSGAVGKALEAAVATRLLQEGVGAVVAMAYTVYAVAAAEFMTAFYERLFAGDTVTDAVGAGRRRLHRRARRPSPKGELPLADWVVPVHYRRRDVHFPELRSERNPPEALDAALDELRGKTHERTEELEPMEAFVGRDGLFYDLERAARLRHVVVLHGPGGTGKTELAKAFGRWWRDTGGVDRPDLVIVQSFEPGAASFGLDGIVAEMGLRIFGPDFAQLDPDQRLAEVEDACARMRLLLIWDNFETVASMPDPTGVTPPLEDAERDRLRAFVERFARRARGALIVTSRSEERWLAVAHPIAVGGLAPHEADEYAEQVLAPHPGAAAQRTKPAYPELREWLGGHPLSMRLVLPHLATTDPSALLA